MLLEHSTHWPIRMYPNDSPVISCRSICQDLVNTGASDKSVSHSMNQKPSDWTNMTISVVVERADISSVMEDGDGR